MGESANETREPFLPWRVPAVPPGAESRTARLRLADGRTLDEPVEVLAERLEDVPGARVVARSSRGEVVAAVRTAGRGMLGRTLVLDTWRWWQRGREKDYGAYWSALLSEVARRQPPMRGVRLAEPSAPLFVDEPVQLMASEGGGKITTWPTAAGWEDLATGAGGSLRVHVQPGEALARLRVERSRSETARLAALSSPRETGRSAVPKARREAEKLSGATAWMAFAVFVAAMGLLWWDERRNAAWWWARNGRG
jgi:hypothetical protein